MKLKRVILHGVKHAGNLGAVARACANFGVGELYLVEPVADPADPVVEHWACGALELVSVRVSESLDDAASGLHMLVGTASLRGRARLPAVAPEELRAELSSRGGYCGLLFGCETSGLPTELLDRCDLVLTLPTVRRFPVMNLAQAVAVSLALLSPAEFDLSSRWGGGGEPPTVEQMGLLWRRWEEALLAVGYLDRANPARMMRKLKRLLVRASPSAYEVELLLAVANQVLWAVRQGSSGGAFAEDHGGDGPQEDPEVQEK